MPSTNSRNLTLTTVGLNTTIDVTYNAVFTEFERHLVGLGLVFQEQIAVQGVDAGGATVIANFTNQTIPVTDGAGSQTIARARSRTVTRASLNEDAGLGDNDEIRCRIRIAAIGLPPAVTPDAFTDQEILIG